jgi:predicted RNA-binding Zn ribbon-like protein
MFRNERFQFVAHYNCLDFVNTEFIKLTGQQGDPLGGFPDLMEWLLEFHLIKGSEARHALRSWGHDERGERVYRDALALRAALRRMAEQLAGGRPVPHRSIEVINKTILKRPGCVLRARGSGRFQEMTRLDPDQPDHLLVPVAQSASDLLCHADLKLVKRCSNQACHAFFYDTSKNHTQRWCSRSCGNRMRVAAHYRRRRAAG